MKKIARANIEIILVEPEHPGNIGAAARAMNNMGFLNLGLVNPVDYLVAEGFQMAWNSHEILKKARVYSTIPEAVSDKLLVVAMTNRQGKSRGHFELLHEFVPQINQAASKGKVGILFGRESSGLLNEEIQSASRCVRIHTAGFYSSLNLAQAVLITCYELLKSEGVVPPERPLPATNEELERCFRHVEEVLLLLGYRERHPDLPRHILRTVKQLAGRALPDSREVQMVRGLCSQVEKMKNGWQKREP